MPMKKRNYWNLYYNKYLQLDSQVQRKRLSSGDTFLRGLKDGIAKPDSARYKCDMLHCWLGYTEFNCYKVI